MSEMAYATGGGMVQYACGHICQVVTTSVDTVPFQERGAMLCPECLKKTRILLRLKSDNCRLSCQWKEDSKVSDL